MLTFGHFCGYSADDVRFHESTEDNHECADWDFEISLWVDVVADYQKNAMVKHNVVFSKRRLLIIFRRQRAWVNCKNPIIVFRLKIWIQLDFLLVIVVELVVKEARRPVNNDEKTHHYVQQTHLRLSLRRSIQISYYLTQAKQSDYFDKLKTIEEKALGEDIKRNDGEQIDPKVKLEVPLGDELGISDFFAESFIEVGFSESKAEVDQVDQSYYVSDDVVQEHSLWTENLFDGEG